MQVSQVNDHCTHAVIGGKPTIDFSISSSAEFFNILSSTLYQDQILAVVREVLCNAWDAHIEAGCTNKPVEITLNHDSFIIKDFGTGIHHDDMGPIYATYGNSTKTNDGNQTGGFGLGCKAPFAYTDHFEVISCYEGIKTIYNLSKSSAQAQGKPGIVPIASFPTTDTGLQVSIRIKNGGDYSRFAALIRRIVSNGDMNMLLNNEPIKKLNFDTSKNNYLITRSKELLAINSAIMVRYGNVIYPVDNVPELKEQYGAITSHLNKLARYQGVYNIIFQAPPHSISVTPSRESLSMQEHTVATLRRLFKGFLDTLSTEFVDLCNDYALTVTKQAVADNKLGALLSKQNYLPGVDATIQLDTIDDLGNMAQQYMSRNYPTSLEFRKADIRRRLTLMAEAKLLDRGIVQTYLRDLENVQTAYLGDYHWLKDREKNTWLQRQVLAPLVTKLTKVGLDHKKLFVCDPDIKPPDCDINKHSNLPLTVATQVNPDHLFLTLPYLRNIVVLATAKTGLIDRVFKHDVFKTMGNAYGFLFYHVGMKAAEKAAALAFFKTTGMKVVDLTFKQEWEGSVNPKSAKPKKPVKKGVVALSALIQNSKHIDTKRFHEENVERLDQPEFVVQLSFKQGTLSNRFNKWSSTGSACIVELFGSKGGAVNNAATHAGWITKGAKDFDDYVREQVCNYIQNSPTIAEYWAFHPERVICNLVNYTQTTIRWIRMVYSVPVLMTMFSLVNPLTDKDKKYLQLWQEINNRYDPFSCAEVKATKAKLEAISLDPLTTAMVTKITTSPFQEFIDIEAIASTLRDSTPQSPRFKQALALLTIVFN